MFSTRLRPLFAAALVCAAFPIHAQVLIPKRILFVGTTMSQSELLAASGMKPGASTGPAQIRAGAQTFLLRHHNELHSLDGWSASFKQYAHLDTDIVDLVVTFHQGGTLQ